MAGSRKPTAPQRRASDSRIDELTTAIKEVKSSLAINTQTTAKLDKWLIGDVDPKTGEPINGWIARVRKLEAKVDKLYARSDAWSESWRKYGRWIAGGIVTASATIVTEAVFKYVPSGIHTVATWVAQSSAATAATQPHITTFLR